MQWLEKITRTQTKVDSMAEEMAERRKGHTKALRTLAAVEISLQLLLWVCFGGYDRAAHTVWQPALLLALPFALLCFVWTKAAPGLAKNAGKWLPLALLPCLMGDAALLLYALTGLIDSMIPEYPFAVGALSVAAVCWLTVLISREKGVAYGLSVLKWALVLFFLLGTVLLNASRRADRLWPMLGQGFANTLRSALPGAGAAWGAALFFVLPKEEHPTAKTSLWALVPWTLGAVWALWHGFLRPWTPGDALSVGERVMGLARHASGVINYQLAALLWLCGGPAALCANALSAEMILHAAAPRFPRALASLIVLVPALIGLIFFTPQLPLWLTVVLPWRAVVSLAAGLGLWALTWRAGR